MNAGQFERGFFGLVAEDLLGQRDVGRSAFQTSTGLNAQAGLIVGLGRCVLS
ncbi:hypothetical protein D9M68_677200 [compost metagenome]